MSDLIHAHLATLRQRAHGAELARCVGRLLVVLVAGLAAWLILDYWFVTAALGVGGWDVLARVAMSGGVLWLVGREAWRGVLTEMRRQRHDDELAMRLEHANPQLGGRLISTVQLQRSLASGGERAVGSPALVEALAAQTGELAKDLDPRLAWPLEPARRAMLLAGGLLLAAVLLVVWRSDIAGAFLHRLFFLPAHYPTATRIVTVSVPALVGRGDPVVIEVEVDPESAVPEHATATVTGSDGRSSSLRLDAVAGESRTLFRATIAQAIEDLRIRPRAGDHRWEREEEVRVVQRPAVASLDLRLVHPAYLRMADAVSTVGDLQVPAGTRVEVSVGFSRPVIKAELSVVASGAEPVRSDLDLAADGASARGSFTADADGTWSIALTAADGLATADPPRWTLVAIPDRAPTVVVTFPPRDKDASRFARWPLRYTARDDHAIAGLRLRWLVIPPGADADAVGGEPASQEAELPAPGAALQGEIPFDLAPLALEAGSRVVWWLEARDGQTPEPGVGASQRGTFTILDPRELRERMAREKNDLLNTLKTLRDGQNDAKAGVEGIRKSIDGKK